MAPRTRTPAPGQTVSIAIPEPLGWVLAFGKNDWILWTRPDHFEARVRLNPVGPRITVTGLAVLADDDESVSASQLRELPLGRLEDALNHPVIAREVQAPRLEGQARSSLDFAPTEAQFDWSLFDHTPLTIERTYRIDGVDEPRRPDAFYRAVAAAWATAVLYNEQSPAEALASANHVALSAVHRWVREARKRGVMAPSGRGA